MVMKIYGEGKLYADLRLDDVMKTATMPTKVKDLTNAIVLSQTNLYYFVANFHQQSGFISETDWSIFPSCVCFL